MDFDNDTLQRFWSKVNIKGPYDCWDWTGSLYGGSGGYGGFKLAAYTKKRAHRVAYEIANGPIPDGMFVCHSCDRPACCNPKHLWLGTAAENNLDRTLKGRTVFGNQSGEANGAARLTAPQVAYIKRLIEAGYNNCEIARWYEVHHATISQIRRQKTWEAEPAAELRLVA